MHSFFGLCVFGVLSLNFVDGSSSKVRFPSESVEVKDSAGHGQHSKLLRSAAGERSRPPMLELVSVSLDTFGSKTENSSITPDVISVRGDGHLTQPVDLLFLSNEQSHQNPLAQVKKLADMFDSRSLQARPLEQALNLHIEPSKVTLGQVFMVLFLILVSALIFAYVLSLSYHDSTDADDEKVDDIPKLPKDDKQARMDLQSQSSWARAYYEAEGNEKEAFELLFRCNIISTEEFACSAVSQEHIQESLWIATHMLQHKPLEEWIEVWQQAQQGFEDSVAECFEARGGQVGQVGRALAQRLTISRNPYMSPGAPTSMPSSANLDYVSTDPNLDLRPLQS